MGAILTMFVTPYQIAFQESQSVFKQLVDVLEKLLLLLFVVDNLINFNFALYKGEHFILNTPIVSSHTNIQFNVLSSILDL